MNIKKCADEYCKFKVFEEGEHCIFHSDKESWILGDDDTEASSKSYFNKKWNKEKVECFWEQLGRYIKYIIKLENREYKKSQSSMSVGDESPFNFLNQASICRTFSPDGKSNVDIYLRNIKFPPSLASSVASNIFEVKHESVRNLYFAGCHFYDNFVDIARFDAKDVGINLNFWHSNFKGNLYFDRFNNKYNNISIEDCEVDGDIAFLSHFNEIIIKNTKASSIIINSSPDRYQSYAGSFHIKKIILKQNTAEEIYMYNKINIDTIEISDFKEQIKTIEINRAHIQKKMLLQNLDINGLTIKNADFLEDSKVILQNLTMKHFSLLKILQDTKVIMLENVTVNKNFRCNKMNFKNTDFNNFNVQKARKLLRDVSFVDSRINILNWGNIQEIKAPRNIFRLIKHVYDEEANYIEANKFYSMEMKKHKEQIDKHLWFSSFWEEKSLFLVNKIASNFGQSYIRPVGWIVFFALLYSLIIYGNDHNWLMRSNPYLSKVLNTIVHLANYPLKEFKPLEKILKKDFECMSFFFNIIFSVLIWQTIVAVKRHTKR
jgi:hypothetical protein